MDALTRETLQRAGPLEGRLQIAYREVERFGRGVRRVRRRHVEHLQGHGPAFEITACASLFAAFDAEQLGVERNRRVEVADLDVEAEKLGNVVSLLHWHS
jgi:hypothetical protein